MAGKVSSRKDLAVEKGWGRGRIRGKGKRNNEMARGPQKKMPESRRLSADDLRMAIKKLERRISELKSFDVKVITKRFDATSGALEDKVNDTLADIFGYDTVEYKKYDIGGPGLYTLPLIMGEPEPPLSEVQKAYQEGINNVITRLKSLKDTLEEKLSDIEEDYEPSAQSVVTGPHPDKKTVFIVHGHDEASKQTVARFIEKLELDPIILHEQPNEGRTVIEKFEYYTNVSFAVVLITPDDVGGQANQQNHLKTRARQNVIFELGFFAGILGRKRVCALYTEGVEMPSDYSGVLYVPMDAQGGWQLQLAREMKAAGVEVDLNKAI